jgi:hypothetical protein
LEDLIARFMASKGSAVGSRAMFDGGDAAVFVNEAAIAGVREEEASLAESFGAVAAEDLSQRWEQPPKSWEQDPEITCSETTRRSKIWRSVRLAHGWR